MTQSELIEVAEYMRRMEDDKTVRIAFEEFESIYGLTYKGNNDKYLVLINKNLSYEKQIETLWHEAKHIYSHAGKKGDLKVFEKEADEFSKCCSKNKYLLSNFRTAL